MSGPEHSVALTSRQLSPRHIALLLGQVQAPEGERVRHSVALTNRQLSTRHAALFSVQGQDPEGEPDPMSSAASFLAQTFRAIGAHRDGG